MRLFHGTSSKHLKEILSDGVQVPSYWTNEISIAIEYAQSWGNGVVLSCESNGLDVRANMLVIEALFDNGEIDSLIPIEDLQGSLELTDSVVCHDIIREIHVLTKAELAELVGKASGAEITTQVQLDPPRKKSPKP